MCHFAAFNVNRGLLCLLAFHLYTLLLSTMLDCLSASLPLLPTPFLGCHFRPHTLAILMPVPLPPCLPDPACLSALCHELLPLSCLPVSFHATLTALLSCQYNVYKSTPTSFSICVTPSSILLLMLFWPVGVH